MADIAIIGGGPGGLTAAIALARRGVRSTVFERDAHPERMSRFNPDRSYPIDLTGHGLRAVRHIDALAHFDAHMIRFRGIRNGRRMLDPWSEPGWIGSRGDIMRALMSGGRLHLVHQRRYQNPWMFLRAIIATAFGVNVASQSKSSTRSYAQVRRAAGRLGPLWAS